MKLVISNNTDKTYNTTFFHLPYQLDFQPATTEGTSSGCYTDGLAACGPQSL